MMRFLAVALTWIATIFMVCGYSLTESAYESAFTQWADQHNKVYTLSEYPSAFQNFKSHVDYIHQHNQRKNHSYTLGLNAFSDLTTQQFTQFMYTGGYRAQTRTGTRANKRTNQHARSGNASHVFDASASVPVPSSLDWRALGAVTPVKNQGQCGACWAFSATGALEGAWFLSGNPLTSLSEQQLMDCSTAYGNAGCSGGTMDGAFQWIIANHGIASEGQVPYVSGSGINPNYGLCKPYPGATTCTTYADVPANDESALLAAVNLGPVSVAIQGSQNVFVMYASGVFDSDACGTQLDHAVLLVGYGFDPASQKNYWIVKNSWGSSWGEQGYVRIVRGKNMCGIALAASYPII